MNWTKLSKYIVTVVILLAGQMSFASVTTEAQAQYNRGIEFYNAGQLDQSLECFKQAVTLNPNYIDAYYNMGSILEYLHNDAEALNAFKQIILRKPDDYESVYKAAEISHRLGEDDKAVMYLTLIPTDTLIGQKAKQLSQELNTAQTAQTTPTVTEEKPQQTAENQKKAETVPQIAQTETPAPAQNEVLKKVYDNISSPTGIVTDSAGNVYVADFADNLIYKIGTDGKKIIYIKNQRIDGPIGLAIDKNDNIYVANYNKDNIVKVDTTGAVTAFLSNIPKPYCMYISGDMLFVSLQGNNTVLRQKLPE